MSRSSTGTVCLRRTVSRAVGALVVAGGLLTLSSCGDTSTRPDEVDDLRARVQDLEREIDRLEGLQSTTSAPRPATTFTPTTGQTLLTTPAEDVAANNYDAAVVRLFEEFQAAYGSESYGEVDLATCDPPLREPLPDTYLAYCQIGVYPPILVEVEWVEELASFAWDHVMTVESEGGGSFYVAPDPATIRQFVRLLFRDILGRSPTEQELEILTQEYLAIDAAAFEADAGWDVPARFGEYFLDVYAGELELRERSESIARARELDQRILACADAIMRGESQPDFCF